MANARLVIDLLLPGLFARAEKRLPALEHVLARADRHVEPPSSESLLFSLFGYALEPALPVAAVDLLGEGGVADGVWLRADPVQFLPARDHVIIGPTGALTADEVAVISKELDNHFGAAGWQVRGGTGCIYLSVPSLEVPVLPATADVLGRSLGAVLPHDRAHLPWLARINEIQMLLHGSGVNRAREKQSTDPVNGLWLWGAGPLPEARPSPFVSVWGGDALARGLARLGGREPHPLPDKAMAVFEAGQGHHLVVLPEGCALPMLESDWFSPLRDALRTGRLSRLTVHAMDGRAFEVTPWRLRRFWRRRRPLESYRA